MVYIRGMDWQQVSFLISAAREKEEARWQIIILRCLCESLEIVVGWIGVIRESTSMGA